MRTGKRWLAAGLLSIGAVFMAGGARAEDPAQHEPTPEQMQQWMEMNKPTAHHEVLASIVGVFDVENRWSMAPGAPEQVSTGKNTNTMVMDGRYLLSQLDGAEMMGMKFQGMGMLGYDNLKQKHVVTWVDNMGTGIMYAEGDCDESGRVITFRTEIDNPMAGGKMPVRFVYTIAGPDQYVFDWYETHGDQEAKTMTIAYTRTK